MIFFDNASTTTVYPEVQKLIAETNNHLFYNPSALYKSSVDLKNLMNEVRKTLISRLGGSFFDKFIFTSGATEANNLALRGALKRNGKLLVSAGEHSSVFNTAKALQNDGYMVDFIKLTSNGVVDEADLLKKLDSASVVSIMHVSNETGAVNDLQHLVHIIKKVNPKIIVHSDGVQAFGKIPVNVNSLGVDLYTISAHKIHGPKGVGGLYVKKDVVLKPIITGGEHEFGLRAGTENVSGILALGLASNLKTDRLKVDRDYVLGLKTHFLAKLNEISDVVVPQMATTSPYICIIAVPNIKSETILHMLESRNIMVGNGSACNSSHDQNRILKEMGYGDEVSRSSIRISFSEENTIEEVDELIRQLKGVIADYKRNVR